MRALAASTCLGALGLFWCSLSADAATLAEWDFQTGTQIQPTPNTQNPLVASGGLQAGIAALRATGGPQSALLGANSLSAVQGTALNTAGTGMSPNITTYSALSISDFEFSTVAFTFSLSMTGYTDLRLSYATRRSGDGFRDNQWSYSTDGTNFTPWGGQIVPETTYSVFTLPDLPTVANASLVHLRYTMFKPMNVTSFGNTNRIDNILITANTYAAPEPSVMSLALVSSTLLLGRRRARSSGQ